uniref:glutathione transferase n=1 Tax=Panagrolaimus superbus TaxID=310955 RepID=A0A914YBM5_9BILA
MTEYKLYYFDVRNLAEPIRLMLHYNGAEFEDIRVDMEKWPSLKPEMPQSTIPVLEVNGKKLAQSHSIMRYLGRVYSKISIIRSVIL